MIEVATEKAAEESDAERIRETVLAFIGYMVETGIPLPVVVEGLTRHIKLFQQFGILNGKEKYVLETLFSWQTDELNNKEAEAHA